MASRMMSRPTVYGQQLEVGMNQERAQEGTATIDGLAKPWLTRMQNRSSADLTDERLKAHRLKDQGKEASKARGHSVCNARTY